jgi:hypothetical protein
MIEGATREETIDLTVRITGMPRDEAEFIAALEAGEIDGDDILIDEDGLPVANGQKTTLRHVGPGQVESRR